jgi:hypothetical protein
MLSRWTPDKASSRVVRLFEEKSRRTFSSADTE